MPVTLDDGLRALADASARAKAIRVDLDDRYLRAIALVESLPQNQSGADKTWISEMDTAFRRHYRLVKPR